MRGRDQNDSPEPRGGGYDDVHEHDGSFLRRGREDQPLRRQPPTQRYPDGAPGEPDANGSVVLPDGFGNHSGGQAALFGPDQLVGYEYSGPVPPPAMIAEYDRRYPGSGKRIMDDAHENQVLDRYVTKKSFDAAVFLEKGGFFAAVGVVVACLILMSVSIFVFENNVGGALFGLGAATPIVLGFLGNQRPKDKTENGPKAE